MILKSADIFDSDFALRRADVRVEDGKIAEIGENLNGFLRRSAGHARNHVTDSRELRRNFVLSRVDDPTL